MLVVYVDCWFSYAAAHLFMIQKRFIRLTAYTYQHYRVKLVL